MPWLITHRAGHRTDYREDHCVCASVEEAIDEVRSTFGINAARLLAERVGAMLPNFIYPASGEVSIHISSKSQGGAGLVASDDSGALMDTILLRSINLSPEREWFGCLTRE